jgi:hypothetical protein
MIVLYVIRSRAVFLAAAGFAFSGVGFIVLEAGHFPVFAGLLQMPGFTLIEARAVVEGLMAAFLILCLVSYAELRRAMPVTGNLILLAGVLAFALGLRPGRTGPGRRHRPSGLRGSRGLGIHRRFRPVAPR